MSMESVQRRLNENNKLLQTFVDEALDITYCKSGTQFVSS